MAGGYQTDSAAMTLTRLFSTLKSSILPLNTPRSKLKIYSSLGGGNSFRLTNGTKVSAGTVIIGANHYRLCKEEGKIETTKVSVKDAMRVLLKTIRPVPEILVIGQANGGPLENWEDVKEEFGCSVEVSESLTAATTFNTLIDDDRSVIGVFH